MGYAGNAYEGILVGSIGSATLCGSAAASVSARAISSETATATVASTGSSLSLAIVAERKVLIPHTTPQMPIAPDEQCSVLRITNGYIS